MDKFRKRFQRTFRQQPPMGALPRPLLMRPETPYSSNFHSTIGQSSAEFARFLACGGTAALINIVSRYFLSGLVSFPSAVLIAYAIGMVVAYTLFRTLVF